MIIAIHNHWISMGKNEVTASINCHKKLAQKFQALEFPIDTCIHCRHLIRGDHKIKKFREIEKKI